MIGENMYMKPNIPIANPDSKDVPPRIPAYHDAKTSVVPSVKMDVPDNPVFLLGSVWKVGFPLYIEAKWFVGFLLGHLFQLRVKVIPVC
jgi:hypothetical protein